MISGLAKIKLQDKEKIIFKIVGTGSYVKRLNELPMKLGIKVLFEGYIPYEKMPSVINDADCCICPLPDREGWEISSPLKIFEYLACAKPVILTPITAHKQIVNDEDFIIWTDGYKAEDFSVAIEYAYNNSKRLKENARKAPQFIRENYDWHIQGKRFTKYLKNKLK